MGVIFLSHALYEFITKGGEKDVYSRFGNGNSGRVFVYLANTEISKRFLQDAENEGFTFCNGARPTSRRADNIMAVNEDRTINYVGFAGHVAFGSATEIGGRPLIKVDYQKFIKI